MPFAGTGSEEPEFSPAPWLHSRHRKSAVNIVARCDPVPGKGRTFQDTVGLGAVERSVEGGCRA